MPSAVTRHRGARCRHDRPPTRLTAWPTVGVLLTCALLAGCATVTSPSVPTPPAPPTSAHQYQPPPSSAGAASTPPPPEPSVPPAALVADLVPAPAGAHAWDGGAASRADVLTLPQFVQALYGTTGATVQQTENAQESARGFEYAVRRNWIALDGSKADVVLIKFHAITGAASFFIGYQDADTTAFGSASGFTVAAAGNAAGFDNPALDQAGDASVQVLDQRGDIGVLIEYFTPATPDRAAASALIAQQYARLPDLVGQPSAGASGT